MEHSNDTNDGVLLLRLNEVEVKHLSPLLLFLSLIGLSGIPGNSFVIYAFRKSWKISNSKLFFVWLAIIDLLNCTVALPLEFVNVVNQYTYEDKLLCKITIFSTYWLTLTSGITLVIITIDRFRKVCRPLARQFSNKVARRLCITSAIAGLGLSWPVLILYGTHKFEIEAGSAVASECSITNNYKHTDYMKTYSAGLGIIFVVTFAITMMLYAFIGKQIFKQSKARKRLWSSDVSKTDSSDGNQIEPKQNKVTSFIESDNTSAVYHQRIGQKVVEDQTRARKSALIMFLISMAFIVSFVPYTALRLLQSLTSDFVASMTATERAVFKSFLRTYWLNCAINPFIYCACAPEFRKEFKRLWACFKV